MLEIAKYQKAHRHNKSASSGLFLHSLPSSLLPPQTVSHEREMIWRVFAKRPEVRPWWPKKMALISPLTRNYNFRRPLPLVITMDGWALCQQGAGHLNSPPFQMITSDFLSLPVLPECFRLSSVCLNSQTTRIISCKSHNNPSHGKSFPLSLSKHL